MRQGQFVFLMTGFKIRPSCFPLVTHYASCIYLNMFAVLILSLGPLVGLSAISKSPAFGHLYFPFLSPAVPLIQGFASKSMLMVYTVEITFAWCPFNKHLLSTHCELGPNLSS